MGIGESTIDSLLDDLMRQHNPTVGLAAHMGQADVRIAARAESAAAAEKAIDAVEAEVRSRIGAYIYSTTPDEKYETYLARRLQEHGYSVALLETNTRGAIAGRLSAGVAEFDPVKRRLVSSGSHLPEVLGSTLAVTAAPAESAVRAAAQALSKMSDAAINVAVVGSSGEGEGIFGTTSGETWVALTDVEGTQAARLPFGGTEEFTVVRIGNFVMRMIDDAVDGLLREVGQRR
jgi:nicotinamide-nucleotide amidase